MYVIQIHVDEYVAYVRSGDVVTRNDIRGDNWHKVTILPDIMVPKFIEIYELEDEGPETPMHSDWEMWDDE